MVVQPLGLRLTPQRRESIGPSRPDAHVEVAVDDLEIRRERDLRGPHAALEPVLDYSNRVGRKGAMASGPCHRSRRQNICASSGLANVKADFSGMGAFQVGYLLASVIRRA